MTSERWYVASCGWAHPNGICRGDHGAASTSLPPDTRESQAALPPASNEAGGLSASGTRELREVLERWGPAIMESGGDQALTAFENDLAALAATTSLTPASLEAGGLEQAGPDRSWSSEYMGGGEIPAAEQAASQVPEAGRFTEPGLDDFVEWADQIETFPDDAQGIRDDAYRLISVTDLRILKDFAARLRDSRVDQGGSHGLDENLNESLAELDRFQGRESQQPASGSDE